MKLPIPQMKMCYWIFASRNGSANGESASLLDVDYKPGAGLSALCNTSLCPYNPLRRWGALSPFKRNRNRLLEIKWLTESQWGNRLRWIQTQVWALSVSIRHSPILARSRIIDWVISTVLQLKEWGLLGEMHNFRPGAEKVQDVPGTSCGTRK